jgi:serpin B
MDRKMEVDVAYKEATKHVEKANNDFNAKLYQHIAKGNNHNIVISPFSVTSVMSMVLSEENGEKGKQIKTDLSLPENKYLLPGLNHILGLLNSRHGVSFVFQSANRVYTKDEFELRGDFLEVNKKYYHLANPETINFYESEEARVIINTWVHEQTNGKMKGFTSPDLMYSHKSSDLVLVNAMYFKGDWDSKFNTKDTLKQDFYVGKGSTVEVDMCVNIQ